LFFYDRQTPYAQGPEDSPEKILARIDQGTLDLTSGNWRNISPAAKDLVQRMLHVDPGARISAMKLLQHPWINDRAKLSEFKLTVADVKIKVCGLYPLHTYEITKTNSTSNDSLMYKLT